MVERKKGGQLLWLAHLLKIGTLEALKKEGEGLLGKVLS